MLALRLRCTLLSRLSWSLMSMGETLGCLPKSASGPETKFDRFVVAFSHFGVKR